MNNGIIVICACIGAVTGFVSLVLSITALYQARRSRIREVARHQVDAFKAQELDNRIHLKFNEMYNRKMANEPTRPVDKYINETVSAPKPSTEIKPSLADSQVVEQNEPTTPKSEETSASVAPVTEENKEEGIQPGTEIKLDTPITLYASIYRAKAFKKVSTTPDDYTIYNITTSSLVPTSGVITIDVNAYAKVGTTPDFLDEACIVSGNGSNVKVTKPGIVTKEGENWIVTEQIEVELN